MLKCTWFFSLRDVSQLAVGGGQQRADVGPHFLVLVEAGNLLLVCHLVHVVDLGIAHSLKQPTADLNYK